MNSNQAEYKSRYYSQLPYNSYPSKPILSHKPIHFLTTELVRRKSGPITHNPPIPHNPWSDAGSKPIPLGQFMVNLLLVAFSADPNSCVFRPCGSQGPLSV